MLVLPLGCAVQAGRARPCRCVPPGACTRVPRAEACPAGSACIPEPMGPVPARAFAAGALMTSALDVRCEAQVCK